jgi:transcriptional regulator with XRE-family HTH domain
MTTGDRIKIARENLGLSQEQLAERLGYSTRTTISRIESGSNQVSLQKILEFAQALRVTPQWLAGWEDEDTIIMKQDPEAQMDRCIQYLDGLNIMVSPEVDPEKIYLSDDDLRQTWYVYYAQSETSAVLEDNDFRQRCALLCNVAKELFSGASIDETSVYLHQSIRALNRRDRAVLKAAVEAMRE